MGLFNPNIAYQEAANVFNSPGVDIAPLKTGFNVLTALNDPDPAHTAFVAATTPYFQTVPDDFEGPAPTIFSQTSGFGSAPDSQYVYGKTPDSPYVYGNPATDTEADYSIWGTKYVEPVDSQPVSDYIQGPVTPGTDPDEFVPPTATVDGGSDYDSTISSDTDWSDPDSWVTENITRSEKAILNFVVPGLGTIGEIIQGMVTVTNPVTGELSYTRFPWYEGSAGDGYGYTKDDIQGGWDESFDDYNTGDLWAVGSEDSLADIATNILEWGKDTASMNTQDEWDALFSGEVKGPWYGSDVYNASLEGYREEEQINKDAAELEAELAADESAAEQRALEDEQMISNIMGTDAVYDAEGNLVTEATGVAALISSSEDATVETITSLINDISDVVSDNQELTTENITSISEAIDEISFSIGDNADIDIQLQSDLLAEIEVISDSLFGTEDIFDADGNMINEATAGVLADMQASIEDNQLTTSDLDSLGITITNDQITAADLVTLTENIADGMVTVSDLEDVGLDIRDFLSGTPVEYDSDGSIVTEATVGALEKLGITILDDSITAADLEELKLNLLDGMITAEEMAAVGLDIKDFLVGTEAVVDEEGNVISEATTGVLDALEASLSEGTITQSDLDELLLDVVDGRITQSSLDRLLLNIKEGLISLEEIESIIGPEEPVILEGDFSDWYDEHQARNTYVDEDGTSWHGKGFDWNQDGVLEGYDEFGYDPQGFDTLGYSKDGYKVSGLNDEGYDLDGYDASGYNKFGYDFEGFTVEGYDSQGYNHQGYDLDGYDSSGYDITGVDSEGYDSSGIDSIGLDADGYDEYGYDIGGYDAFGYNNQGYDESGLDVNNQPASLTLTSQRNKDWSLEIDPYEMFNIDGTMQLGSTVAENPWMSFFIDYDDTTGLNSAGKDREGYDSDGLKNQQNPEYLDPDRKGAPRNIKLDREGYNKEGYKWNSDTNRSYNREGYTYDRYGNTDNMFNTDGFSKAAIDSAHTNIANGNGAEAQKTLEIVKASPSNFSDSEYESAVTTAVHNPTVSNGYYEEYNENTGQWDRVDVAPIVNDTTTTDTGGWTAADEQSYASEIGVASYI